MTSPTVFIPHDMSVRYFFVEGSIGAGKSTLLERMQDRLRNLGITRLVVVPEPLDLWTDCDGHNLLDLFYKDQARWAHTFQVHAMSTRITAVREAIERHRRAEQHFDDGSDIIVLCERSVFTDRHVFVETLVEDGKMSAAEYAAYIRAFNYFGRHDYPGEHAGVIYLRTRPETCKAHMQERDRTEESGVPLDYLQRLHAQHERAIADTLETWRGAERLILDVERLGRINDDDEAADKCARQLYEFITKDGERQHQHQQQEQCKIA